MTSAGVLKKLPTYRAVKNLQLGLVLAFSQRLRQSREFVRLDVMSDKDFSPHCTYVLGSQAVIKL
jgi:hypothetical protein